MNELWAKQKEIDFFNQVRQFASPEKFFYLGDDSRYYAYWPKSYHGTKSTLQSRNALIGNYTEKVDHLLHAGIIQGFWSVNSNLAWSRNNETEKVRSKNILLRLLHLSD